MKVYLFSKNENEINALKKTINNLIVFDNANELNKTIAKNEIEVLLVDGELIDKVNKPNKTKKMNIIIIHEDDSYKALAFDIKASGYIVKPISKSSINKALSDLRFPISEERKLLRVQCFGNFDCYTMDGKIVQFKRSRSKELLAYLVSKKGTSCTIKEILAILFEDDCSSSAQGYLQQLLFSLNKTLIDCGCGELLTRSRNAVSIKEDLIDCDYYRFLDNDASAKRYYTGSFMSQYEWADYIAAYLDSKSV